MTRVYLYSLLPPASLSTLDSVAGLASSVIPISICFALVKLSYRFVCIAAPTQLHLD